MKLVMDGYMVIMKAYDSSTSPDPPLQNEEHPKDGDILISWILMEMVKS